jgi:ribose transport system ATP-binding protein
MTPDAAAPLLEARGIRKSFNGVEVLHGVDFTLHRGQIHGVVGQNGAGKSTLMKILNGVYSRDAGEVLIEGEPVDYDTPLGARRAGIAMVFQEFSLVPTMTVAQNVLLTREPTGAGLIDLAEERRRTLAAIEPLGVRIDPAAKVGDLPIGTRQLVEIAKAISQAGIGIGGGRAGSAGRW